MGAANHIPDLRELPFWEACGLPGTTGHGNDGRHQNGGHPGHLEIPPVSHPAFFPVCRVPVLPAWGKDPVLLFDVSTVSSAANKRRRIRNLKLEDGSKGDSTLGRPIAV
jgi:hypothetical protein